MYKKLILYLAWENIRFWNVAKLFLHLPFLKWIQRKIILIKNDLKWERNGNPLQCSCLENPRDGGAAVYGVAQSRTRLKRLSSSSSKVRKGFPGGAVVKNPSAMQETQVWSLGGEDPLEKGITNHSSILAWEIPWTEEPGGLQSMGSDTT